MFESKKSVSWLFLSSLVVLGLLFWATGLNSNSKVSENTGDINNPVKIVKVNVEVVIGSNTTKYTEKIEDGSSLQSLMERLRKANKIEYELTGFTYGDVLTSINGVNNDVSMGKQWILYINSVKTKELIKNIKIQKDYTYKWTYEYGTN